MHLDASMLDGILARAPVRPDVYIETGTYQGNQLALAAPRFKRVIGVELDPGFADITQTRAPKAEVILANSSKILPQLASEIAEPCFFYLDAHYCRTVPHQIMPSPFPLWDELIALRTRTLPDIIVVDDVHTFGKARPDLRYRGIPDWEGVTFASIASFLGAPGKHIGDCYVVTRCCSEAD